MRVSAKVDYAVRAAVELATAPEGRLVTAETVATAQGIPLKFLGNILQSLRQAGLVESRRGVDGGHRLARTPGDIAIAEVIRAVDGPLAGVSGRRPEELEFSGSAVALREVWIAVRASLRRVLDEVTLADVAAGHIPDHVRALTEDPGAWGKR